MQLIQHMIALFPAPAARPHTAGPPARIVTPLSPAYRVRRPADASLCPALTEHLNTYHLRCIAAADGPSCGGLLDPPLPGASAGGVAGGRQAEQQQQQQQQQPGSLARLQADTPLLAVARHGHASLAAVTRHPTPISHPPSPVARHGHGHGHGHPSPVTRRP
jgi:hypothetical protein